MRLNASDQKALTVFKQPVELTTISGKLAANVEQLTKSILNHRDLIADGQLASWPPNWRFRYWGHLQAPASVQRLSLSNGYRF